jgi:hypothetical protein
MLTVRYIEKNFKYPYFSPLQISVFTFHVVEPADHEEALREREA